MLVPLFMTCGLSTTDKVKTLITLHIHSPNFIADNKNETFNIHFSVYFLYAL